MMDHKYRLSICMMVKDEEKNIRRCLDSLKPLLDKEDVELIVVDTGSLDNTAYIAGEYTDKVFKHPWNSNFSEMRNITISYARGDRIFILDADEVLQDAGKLYELIHDRRLLSYNTYIFKIKNLDSSGGYTVLPQERVFRNDGEFHYEGSVHNQPKYKPPLLNTDIYLEHYGYLFHDKELMEKKFIRTGGILRKELEKDPQNPYYTFQLARCYNAHGDNKDALREIRKTYSFIFGTARLKSMYAYIYGVYAMICCTNNEFEEAVCICREGIEVRSEYIDLYYLMAVSYQKLGRLNEAAPAFIKYLELVEQYENLKISADRAIEMYYTGPQYQDAAAGFIANQLYQQGKYSKSLEYVKKIQKDKDRLVNLVKVFLKMKNFSELKELFIKHREDKSLNETIISTIEAEEVNLSSELRYAIEKELSNGEDLYSLLNKVRCCMRDKTDLPQLDQFIRTLDFSTLPDFYAELLIDIDQNTRRVFSILKKLTKSKIRQYVSVLIDRREGLRDFLRSLILNETIRSDDYHSLRVIISIAYTLLVNEAVIIRKTKGSVTEHYYSIFKKYIEYGMLYANLLYNPDRIRMYFNTLEDPEDRYFIEMNYAIQSISRNDFLSGIRFYKEAAKDNPYLAVYMKKYKDELFPDQEITDGEDAVE